MTENPVDRADVDRYRRLIDAITDYAIYMLDIDGYVSSWNPGARRFKGYEANEIVGQHFSRFYTAEDRAAGVPERALRTAANEGRFDTEGWRVRKDGQRFWAHVVIDPIRDEEGHVVGFAKITRDLTERMQARTALEQAQHALFQTQKLESIGKLTGGIAHDFNNLLTAVIGSLELLRKQLPSSDERAHALLDNALHGAERGSALTQRMLAFARRQELNMKAVGLRPLVDGMLGMLDRSLGPTIKVITEIPESLPPVHTDVNQLETALLNLTLNARDAMGDAGTIRISARRVSEMAAIPHDLPPGEYVAISVSDDGQGMDAATLARAAEPFFTTKGVGKGTGLGLSMVQGLTEQSGGRLSIHSEPGKGTTVTLVMPAAHGDVAPAITSATDIAAAALAPAIGDMSRTVLLVDDDELVLSSAAAIIEDLGYRVIAVESGEAALRIIDSPAEIDVLMTDQAMPEMTGLQLARATAQKRPHLPVILASGFAEVETNSAQGCRRLPKPFRRAELADALASAVRKSQVA
jgi:PAS domain S-box-containing protein